MRLSDPIDRLLLTRALNALILRWDVRPRLLSRGLEQGWNIAEEVTGRLARTAATRIALVDKREERAIEMFRRHGFRLAVHEPLAADEICLPDDPHPNAAGHRVLLAALWPVLERALPLDSVGAGIAAPDQAGGDGGAGRG